MEDKDSDTKEKEVGESSSKKKKKSKGYVQLKDEEKELVGWEGFVETLSKTQASQLSALLKNKTHVDLGSNTDKEKETEVPNTEPSKHNEKPQSDKKKKKKTETETDCSHVKEKAAPLTGPLWGLH